MLLTNTDRLILNYFVPYTNGKFTATCLMFSPAVYKMLDLAEIYQRIQRKDSWANIEYSDVDFWWKDHSVDWFNSVDWIKNLSESAKNAFQQNQYVFYTCHEIESVNYLKQLFPDAQILITLPDIDLCKQNYYSKNPLSNSVLFEKSRVYKEFQNFKSVDTNLTINQQDIYSHDQFGKSIAGIADKLNIKLDIDRVLQYRSCYLQNKFNQI
jgi:hypothetical protein